MAIIIDNNTSLELVYEGDVDKINSKAYGKINIDKGRGYHYTYGLKIVDTTNPKRRMTRAIADRIFKENNLREQLINMLTERVTIDYSNEPAADEYSFRNDVYCSTSTSNFVVGKQLAIGILVASDKSLEDVIDVINKI